jgi:uncharacterized membrane protein
MPTAVLPGKIRINSIDLLRGVVMVIMALDHVRDFFHVTAVTASPTDMNTTTPALFFTRWITHFCAPVFVFLSGTAAFLAGRKKTKKELSFLLLTRGAWLLLIELVVMNFIFGFNPHYNVIAVQVIWVIGWSMVLLSVLLYLPLRILLIIGLVLVAGHNVLDQFDYQNRQELPLWWGLLHQQYFGNIVPGHMLFVLYPLIPWPGVMILGYCMGTWFTENIDAAVRRKYLTRIGLVVTIAFFVLRWINVYGDASLWSSQKNGITTVLSFFNLTKYPPSLLFLCMTLVPALLLLVWFEKTAGRWANFVIVYGRVPMFYYLIHFFSIHFLCMLVFFATGHTMAEAVTPFFWFRPDNKFGYSLGVVYVIWIVLVTALFPLCKWYSNYKANHIKWWLSYL